MSISQLLSLAVFAIFAENIVFGQLLGIDPVLSLSKKTGSALGVGVAVTVVMGLASLLTWAINTYLLIPFGLDGYLQTVAFVLVIAVPARFLDLFLKKAVPSLHKAVGIYLPLITMNCAVLGIALRNTQNGCDAIWSVANGVFGGLGFTLAMVLFACVRERLELAECPRSFEGAPIALVSAGLLAMAFMGFSGLRL